MALEAQKTAMESLIKSNETLSKTAGGASSSATEGFKEAARIAQTTNEKSMDSMAKVATAAAARKPGKEEGEGAQGAPCKNNDCDYVFEGKAKKFCPKCGAGQLVGNS
jgi:predicted Zn-ribbon and HTH transcriptional regulator